MTALAAAKIRRGQEIPKHVQSNMTSIERQILETESHIQSKEDEKTAIFESYQPDIVRLKELEASQ